MVEEETSKPEGTQIVEEGEPEEELVNRSTLKFLDTTKRNYQQILTYAYYCRHTIQTTIKFFCLFSFVIIFISIFFSSLPTNFLITFLSLE